MLWKRAVQLALSANVPCLLEGDPGIGKTSYIYSLARTLDMHPEVVIASLREPADFLGLPVLQGDTVSMAPPAWARRLADLQGRPGLLVLDEITTAPPAVQAALLRVVLERVVGDLPLPESVRIIAIANPADQAGGWELSLPLANRFFHIKAAAPDPAAWARGLQSNWEGTEEIDLPPQVQAHVSKAKALVGGFLSTRPSLLLQVPKVNSAEQAAWASPRSWDSASRLLARVLDHGEDNGLMAVALDGTVGPGPAKEFLSWIKSLDLPTPEEILKNPKAFKVPDRIDKVFVVLDGVASLAVGRIERATDRAAEEAWDGSWEVLGKVCKAGMPDVALTAAKRIVAVRRPEFTLPHTTLDSFRELLTGLTA